MGFDLESKAAPWRHGNISGPWHFWEDQISNRVHNVMIIS